MTTTNYGPISSIVDTDLTNVMGELKGKSPDTIIAFFHDGTNYIAIVKNI